MKLLSVESYNDFECIGGECPISCCGGNWNIFIDDETAEYYKSVEGEFGEELRSGIDFSGKNAKFRLDKNRDCIFLNESRLCSIYRKLGADKMCHTCKTYPRTQFQAGDILFCCLTNSCPEVTRIIMQMKAPLKVLFDDSYESEEELCEKEKHGDDYWSRFNNAIKALSSGVHILQNREISLRDRLILLLFFVESFQEIIKDGSDPDGIMEVFSDPKIYIQLLENVQGHSTDYAGRIRTFMYVFRSMLQKSYDHPMWKMCSEMADEISNKGIDDIDGFKSAFKQTDLPDIQIEMEQLMTYRFFCVFMKGFEESDYYDIVAYEVLKYAALITFMALIEVKSLRVSTQEERIFFYSLCSRIDHSKKQKNDLIDDFTKAGFYEIEKLISIIY